MGKRNGRPVYASRREEKRPSNRKNVLHDETGLCRLPFSFTWFCVLEYGRELPAYSHEKITERRPSAMKIHETLKLCRS